MTAGMDLTDSQQPRPTTSQLLAVDPEVEWGVDQLKGWWFAP